jgi:hypothetical protein
LTFGAWNGANWPQIADYQRTKLALRLEDVIAERAKANKEQSGRDHGVGKVLANLPKPILPINTRAEIAKAAGIVENLDTIVPKTNTRGHQHLASASQGPNRAECSQDGSSAVEGSTERLLGIFFYRFFWEIVRGQLPVAPHFPSF